MEFETENALKKEREAQTIASSFGGKLLYFILPFSPSDPNALSFIHFYLFIYL